MAFEVSKTGYQQIDPAFSPGYPYENKYHNIGQLQTPYQGKKFGQGGDYGPPQGTVYYTDQNRNYPYVLDANFRASEYLPTEGCCFSRPGYFPCYNSNYPDKFVPPNYFSPQLIHPSGHTEPINKYGIRTYSGMAMAYDRNAHPTRPLEREYYGTINPVDYKRLRINHNSLEGANNFFPFGYKKN